MYTDEKIYTLMRKTQALLKKDKRSTVELHTLTGLPFYWLRKFRRQGVVADAPRRRSGFVPVVASSAGDGLSLHLPNGIELRGVSGQNLHVVEQLLARL